MGITEGFDGQTGSTGQRTLLFKGCAALDRRSQLPSRIQLLVGLVEGNKHSKT